MDFENIPDELKEKAKECATPEELLKLAQAEGYELSDDDLAQVAGGDNWLCPSDHCTAVCQQVCCNVGSVRQLGSRNNGKLGVM